MSFKILAFRSNKMQTRESEFFWFLRATMLRPEPPSVAGLLHWPAANARVGQGPSPGESIVHSEGDGGGQQEVRQGQVEYEDVPGCPHLFPP